ncbi:MAG: hypothetical protein HQK54_06780 [Oligoflexales bacterium]|nr:hypothetical protein [Oligoflexales bacterium]
MDMSTDVELLKDVLANDLRMADFASFTSSLGAKLTASQPLRPMLNEVIEGINTKQPVLRDFLCVAVQKDLLPNPENEAARKKIKRAIHLMYLLEELTKKMAVDINFTDEVREYYLTLREKNGIPRDFFSSSYDIARITKSIFEPIKTKTMDYVFDQYGRIRRQGPGTIQGSLFKERNLFLQLNISEAVVTDYLEGRKDNALAGMGLIMEEPVLKVEVLPGSYFVKNQFRSGWPALYESWNMAFVIGNLSNLELLLPKLLIPSVVNATEEDYIFNRGLSLWVTINMHLFAKISGRDEQFPSSKNVAKEFGKVTLSYSKQYVKKHYNKDLNGLGSWIMVQSQLLKNKAAKIW